MNYGANLVAASGQTTNREGPQPNSSAEKKFKALLSIYWEYTEELYQKDPPDPDNHDGVITHLEPDILKCEGSWNVKSSGPLKASLRTKLVEVIEFQFSYFKC